MGDDGVDRGIFADSYRHRRSVILDVWLMGGMDNRTGKGFAKDRRASAHRARSFYKGCYEEFLADPSAQYLMTYSEYKRKWAKKKRCGG